MDNVDKKCVEAFYGNGNWQDETGKWHNWKEVQGSDGASFPRPERSATQNIVDRCRAYVAKMPVSVSGHKGHDAAFVVAVTIFRGFCLSDHEGFSILSEFNARCQPPWSEAELRHKMKDAIEKSEKHWGYIINLTAKTERPQWTAQQQQPRIEVKEDLSGYAPDKSAHLVEPFPVHVYPKALQQYANEVAASLSCPVDFPAAGMLAVAASAIGTARAISITRTWMECARFYLAMVSDPGDAKSPAIKLVCKPLYERQAELSRGWEERNDRLEDKRLDYERRKRDVINGKTTIEAIGSKPRREPYPHLYTTNITTEALAVMLKDSPKGFALIHDEITGWVSSMNQYKNGGKGSDRQFWLTVWSGERSKIDRSSMLEQGSLSIEHPFVTVFGGIQPDMLDELCDADARKDGFIDRILFSAPTCGLWAEEIGKAPSEEAESYWDRAIKSLLNLQMTVNGNGSQVPGIVGMGYKAREVANYWYREHARERNQSDFPADLVGPWSKMRVYYFRIALVLHLLHATCEETDPSHISEMTAVKAGALIEYFKSHAKRVYDLLEANRHERNLDKIVNWINSKTENPGVCSARELMQRKLVKKASQAKMIFKELSDRGMGTMETQPSGNRGVVTVFTSRNTSTLQ